MSKYLLLVASAALLALGSLLSLSRGAAAHERREVLSYTFVVGFLDEPALLNEPNSLDLRVSRTADESPVEGLEETLQVEVTAQGQMLVLELEARFRTPGAYNGYLMPTAAGEYTFHVFGTIEGNEIDETFTSGPDTFSSVNEPLGFPAPYSAAGSAGQLEEAVGGLEQRVASLEDGSDGGGTAMAVGIVGVIVGALGLGVGGLALSRSRG